MASRGTGQKNSEENNWLPECNPLSNRRLENRNEATISVLLTGRGVSEIQPGIKLSRGVADLAPQVKQRVFDGAETLAKLLILNGLFKFA